MPHCACLSRYCRTLFDDKAPDLPIDKFCRTIALLNTSLEPTQVYFPHTHSETSRYSTYVLPLRDKRDPSVRPWRFSGNDVVKELALFRRSVPFHSQFPSMMCVTSVVVAVAGGVAGVVPLSPSIAALIRHVLSNIYTRSQKYKALLTSHSATDRDNSDDDRPSTGRRGEGGTREASSSVFTDLPFGNSHDSRSPRSLDYDENFHILWRLTQEISL